MLHAKWLFWNVCMQVERLHAVWPSMRRCYQRSMNRCTPHFPLRSQASHASTVGTTDRTAKGARPVCSGAEPQRPAVPHQPGAATGGRPTAGEAASACSQQCGMAGPCTCKVHDLQAATCGTAVTCLRCITAVTLHKNGQPRILPLKMACRALRAGHRLLLHMANAG